MRWWWRSNWTRGWARSFDQGAKGQALHRGLLTYSVGAARNTTSGADRPVQKTPLPVILKQVSTTTPAVKPLFSCVVAGSTDTGRDAVGKRFAGSAQALRPRQGEDGGRSADQLVALAKKMTVAAPGRKKEGRRTDGGNSTRRDHAEERGPSHWSSTGTRQ